MLQIRRGDGLCGAFTKVVKNPHIVNILLGRALITHNAMLGVIDDPDELEEEKKAPAPSQERSDKENRQSVHSGVSSHDEFCHRIVDEYFAAFASGHHKDTSSELLQRNFLQHRFASKKQADAASETNRVKERWRVLNECFEVLQFRREGKKTTSFDDRSNLCRVESAARYVLRITFDTVESVFPHLASSAALLDAFVGKVIEVPSHILFSIEKRTGHVSSINEKMEFAAAMAEIVPERHELAFVLSNAFLVDDGVDFYASSVASPAQLSQVCENYRGDSRSIPRTMNIADILG